jgi:hypothetical protein
VVEEEEDPLERAQMVVQVAGEDLEVLEEELVVKEVMVV